MEVQPTNVMTDVIMKIMIEMLSILVIATKQIKRGRSSELIDIHNYFSLTSFRTISEEASRQERYRGCVKEAGYTYHGRGSDGDCGNLEGY